MKPLWPHVLLKGEAAGTRKLLLPCAEAKEISPITLHTLAESEAALPIDRIAPMARMAGERCRKRVR